MAGAAKPRRRVALPSNTPSVCSSRVDVLPPVELSGPGGGCRMDLSTRATKFVVLQATCAQAL